MKDQTANLAVQSVDETATVAPLQAKLKTVAQLGDVAKRLKAQGETVVQAHGTFDLLHVGHLRHLRQAKREGTVLFVTVTGDAFVNKGPGRPVFSERMRAEMLAAARRCTSSRAAGAGLCLI